MPYFGKFIEYENWQDKPVQAGQRLAMMGTAYLEIELKEQEITVAELEKDLANARAGGDAVLIGQKELELMYARNKLEELQKGMNATQFRSPINGVVNYQNMGVRTGDSTVNPGTLLFRIIDQTKLHLAFQDFDERGANAMYYKTGDEVEIKVSKDGKEIMVPAKVIQGYDILVEIGDTDENDITGIPRVLIQFDDAYLPYFFFNQDYQVSKILTSKTNVLIVPRVAVSTYQDRTFVYTVDENGLRAERDVKVGITDGANIEITEGLEVGETVIVSK